MKLIKCIGTAILVMFLPLNWPTAGNAQDVYTLTASISLSERYDDNVFLTPEDEEHDFITEITPGISVAWITRTSNLSLNYSTGFAFYARDTRTSDNRIRQGGTLSYSQQLAERLTMDISDTYVQTDEPIENLEYMEIESVRRGGETYHRNNGRISFSYGFGPGRSISWGYANSLLVDDNPGIVDRMEHSPFVSVSYALDVQNSIQASYNYSRTVYSEDEAFPESEDDTGHAASITYIHSFSLQTSGSVGYSYSTRDFDGFQEGYGVHTFTLGVQHAFSPDLDFSADGGVYHRRNEDSPSETNPHVGVSLTKKFERGSFHLRARSGWTERYLAADQTGFTKTISANAGLSYQIAERVSSHADIGYTWNEDDDDRVWQNYRGGCGLSWSILRWLSMSLDYYYNQRNDDIDTGDYSRNQVWLRLSASHLFRWE